MEVEGARVLVGAGGLMVGIDRRRRIRGECLVFNFLRGGGPWKKLGLIWTYGGGVL